MTKKLHIKKNNHSITLVDEEDIQNKLDEKADATDLEGLSEQIDDIVAGDLDLTTYAKKSDLRTDEIADENTYSNIANVEQTQESINAAIDDKLGALSNVDLVKVVGTRPTASADTMNKLYLVAESSNITEDNYEIFITVRSGSANNYSYTWEKVDTARVNLSNYIQKSSTVGLVKNDGSIDTQTKVNVAQGSGNASKNVVTDSSGNITTEAKPTIPTKTSQLTNDSNYTTATGHNHDGTYIKTGTGTVTSTNIANNTIVNEDIASNAAIAYSKLSGVVSSTDTRLTNKRNPINNEIAANSNLNNFINAGFYYCQGDAEVAPTIVNQPLTSGNQRSFSMIVELISSTRVVQKLTYYFTKDTYIRTNINGTWSTWNCVLHSGNYSNYANKTTVDTALSSTSTNPVQNKVINTALNGKALSTHNHDGTYIKTGTGTVTSTNIADKTIVNGDIADNAAIAYSKLSGVASSTDPRLTDERNPKVNRINASSSNIADLNNYHTTGFYYNGNNDDTYYIKNCPWSMVGNAPYSKNKAFFLLVETWGQSSDWIKQTLTYYYPNSITYIRVCNSGTWQPWKEVTLNGMEEIINSTQAEGSSAWTGTSSRIVTLTTGTRINYWLKTTSGTDNVTLNLTLANGDTTGAKNVGPSYLAKRLPAYVMVELVWDGYNWFMVNPTNVVNDLTTGGTSNALSAEQGKWLYNNKVNIAQGSSNANKTLSTNSSGNVVVEAKNNHTHGSIASGGTLNSDITSVNKVVVTDSSNNIKTISKLPASAVTHQDISGKADKSSYIACTVTYTNGTTSTINFVTR